MEFLLSKIDMMRLSDYEKRVEMDEWIDCSDIFGLQNRS